jgi:hypothetical protein
LASRPRNRIVGPPVDLVAVFHEGQVPFLLGNVVLAGSATVSNATIHHAFVGV